MAGRSIDHAGPITKHAQLRDIIADLADTELAADAAIPSERELMARFGVSRMTVREAIGQLVRSGRLYRVRGKGTFVAPRRVESQLHLASFTSDMRARGYQPGTVVLRAQEAVPPTDVAASLRLETDEPAYRIERLRTADGTPMAVEFAWYSSRVAPGLLDTDLTGSLYATLERRFGAGITRADQTVWAARAEPGIARLLGVGSRAALLVFHRLSYAARLPVENVTSFYRGDRYQVHMSLTGAGGEAGTLTSVGGTA